ncbi:inositol-1-monophosphatase [Candidatus Erwinia haradaeae]|uniref:Inositol-1-monophosphatase n=1 Tax=Candidatus Erwinia haradaeae TaxID=1922217 RepID=A0A451D3A9_9GAMM|nr:inositol-1-monophosphatase [Candidatus Erwinia haradaeae]VFP80147.1 Inositol-1-monophosphatase [Candidatus Erwinia haradaeae]
MHPMLNIAIRTVRQAGNIIIKYYETIDSNEYKQKNYHDCVKYIEKETKRQMTIMILKSYPQHQIITESNHEIHTESKNTEWIINALDGNINYIKHFPYFSISIAIRIKGRNEIAVIYDPMRNEVFRAWRGHGAQLNGYRLRGGIVRDLEHAILSTNCSFKINPNITSYLNITQKLLSQCLDFRRSGSVALDLAYVASGRIDGYLAFNLKPCDFAAGELLIREAGGLVTDFNGSNNYFYSGSFISGNARIVKNILTYINSQK